MNQRCSLPWRRRWHEVIPIIFIIGCVRILVCCPVALLCVVHLCILALHVAFAAARWRPCVFVFRGRLAAVAAVHRRALVCHVVGAAAALRVSLMGQADASEQLIDGERAVGVGDLQRGEAVRVAAFAWEEFFILQAGSSWGVSACVQQRQRKRRRHAPTP